MLTTPSQKNPLRHTQAAAGGSREPLSRDGFTAAPKGFVWPGLPKETLSRPAVVATVVLGGERSQAPADLLHVRNQQAHHLGGVQTQAVLGVVLERVHV